MVTRTARPIVAWPTGGLTMHVRLPPPRSPMVKTEAQLAQLDRPAAIHAGAHATFGLTEETGVPHSAALIK